MSRFVYQGTLQDGNGKRLADGNVAVLLAGTSTPASIYAASTGGVAVASVTTEDDGSWSFYIDEADYAGTQRFDVVRSKSGYLSLTTEDIEVLPASAHVGLTIKDTTDRTKIATLSAAGITTANTRTHTLPDFDAGVVGADHGGTITKIIKFLVSGATAAKTMILASAHTDDRTQTLQDRDGTIANTDAETFTGGMTVVGGMTGSASKVGVLNVKIIDIGTWDMVANAFVQIAHNLDMSKIRPPISAMIRDDPNSQRWDFVSLDFSETTEHTIKLGATTVGLFRGDGGVFDNTDFDTMGDDGNRGWITIWYVD